MFRGRRRAGVRADLLSWTLRILGPYERGRLRVGDKNRREFLNVWGKYRPCTKNEVSTLPSEILNKN